MNTYSEDKMYESYSNEVERMQKYIDELLQENKRLEMINKEYERLNKKNGRGFKITNVQEYNIDELLSYKKYKDNWNKLKEIAKSQSGFKKRADLKGGLWFEINDLLDKMQDIEGSDNQCIGKNMQR